MRVLSIYFVCFLVLNLSAGASAEELIEGEVFDHFQPTSVWSVVGQAEAVEDKLLGTPQTTGQTPILMNASERQRRLPYLLTANEYGDVQVRIEFMIPEGSNSGVYVMGRYEVQIRDSAAASEMKFSDLGGIYERWVPGEKDPVKRGYDGSAPSANAAKAPGEWQDMEIVFRAPRFDADGQKTENARFISVHVNGIQVQDHAECSGPTVSNPVIGEAPTGPLAIQGDHGPIAIRSLKIEGLSLD